MSDVIVILNMNIVELLCCILYQKKINTFQLYLCLQNDYKKWHSAPLTQKIDANCCWAKAFVFRVCYIYIYIALHT